MTMSSMPCCFFARRARARRSITSSPAVSSTMSGAPRSSSVAMERFCVSLRFSSLVHSPRFSLHVFTCARPAIIRLASASTGISSENTITGCRLPPSVFTGTLFMSSPSAQLSAMFIAREVLPTDGLAAMTIISEFLRPWSFSSRWVSPVDIPSRCFPFESNIASMRWKPRSIAEAHGIVASPLTPISRNDFSASPSTACASGYSPSSKHFSIVRVALSIIVRRSCLPSMMLM